MKTCLFNHCRRMLVGAFSSGPIAALALLTVFALPSAAQEFPTKPIRIVVPSGPGIGTDLIARLIAQRLNERLGWTVLVDNKPGGNYLIGSQAVLQQPADGHTVLLAVSSMTVLPATVKDLPVNMLKDFAAVTRVATLPTVVLVTPALPAKTMPELVAYAKKNPTALSYAVTGSGSFLHLAGELLKQNLSISMTHVPYKDTTLIADVASGRVQVAVISVASVAQQIRAGTLRGLAILGPNRSPAIPDVPTMAELGLPEIDGEAWLGTLVRAGTPPDVIRILNREIVAAMQTPEFKDKLPSMGAGFVQDTPEAFARLYAADIARWQQVVQTSKLKFD